MRFAPAPLSARPAFTVALLGLLGLGLAAGLGPALPAAQASPLSPAALDAQIQQCLEDVNADSLFSYIAALQGFTTRHSASDTTSTTTGIGAARRWVHAKFLEFQGQGGNITASYDDFETPLSGVDRLHRNVVGEIPGTLAGTPDERIYVIGGHLDSRNEDVDDPLGSAFGADDDASGVACAIELARVMSMKTWPMTFRFIAFVGEEQGLVGSDFYASRAADRGDPIAAMLNNDTMASIIGAPHPDSTVTTDSTLARVFASPPEEGPHRQFQRYLKAMGDAYVPIQQIVIIPAEDRPSRGGDHESFVGRGFTAIRYMEYLEEVDRQHTTDGDTLGPHLDKNYLRRNAQVDLATLGALALAPATPTGLAVADIGDSTGFRLTWPDTNPEPDLAGYLVTVRRPGDLDYDQVIDVGLANEYVFASAADESLYFGLSVRNTADHRALVGEEKLGVLSSLPGTPDGLEAVPDADSVQLTWNPRAEADLAGYRVYRSATSGSGYVEITTSPVVSPSFDDTTAPPLVWNYYVVTAVDTDTNESGFSVEVAARLVTLDSGILFVDETKNGGTAWFPSDALADSVYAEALINHPHDVHDYDADGPVSLSTLGPYTTVIWASDDFNGSFMGFPAVTQLVKDNIPALRDYLEAGGRLLLAGWEGAQGIVFPAEYEVDPEPGDFLYDYLGLDRVTQVKPKAFTGGIGQGSFGDLALEPTRLRPTWTGQLIRGEYFPAVRPGATVAYRFNSMSPDSVWHLEPCAVTYDGGAFRTMYLGFPLYHLDTLDARAMLDEALAFLGGGATGAPLGSSPPPAFALGPGQPNPFAGETEIRFVVPTEGARVRLDVFDVGGRRVRRLLDDRLPAGAHAAIWDGRNDAGHAVATGVYFTRLIGESGGSERTLTRKLLRLR